MKLISPPITAGMVVLCHDNSSAESQLETGRSYTVAEVTHRGILLKVKDFPLSTFESTRFTPLASTPPTEMELANASNQ